MKVKFSVVRTGKIHIDGFETFFRIAIADVDDALFHLVFVEIRRLVDAKQELYRQFNRHSFIITTLNQTRNTFRHRKLT